ncbi:hypothetical protein [Sphingobium ummariense]|uniref:Uncharacterized protein n=1 Tax=Sphingobium ummariense RL-3 TaxID=1346791 RepID=T0JZP4_9SPHN|nr:hypothetical protein [Sphingobium ummariense]EQB29699.1 hypothetical protein M529_23260 [Sphingobium ummariense RL-3]
MRNLLPSLACLMLVLTGWASMAHAAEAAGGSIAGLEFTLHAPGDGDEVPADSDSGIPHHHANCHGHDVGTPATMPAAECVPYLRVRGDLVADILAGVRGSVLPRPPRI